MDNGMIPEKLYKYKKVVTIEDLEQVADIINNHRLYMPTKKQMNDPLEGNLIPHFQFPVMGQWHYRAMHKNSPIQVRELEKYHILSLSSCERSMQMWAHYAGNYSGVCIEFSTKGKFREAVPINYNEPPINEIYSFSEKIIKSESEIRELNACCQKSLLYKSAEWSNEQEYRIIESNDEKPEQDIHYFDFNSEEITSINIGHNINTICRDYICELCAKQNIPVYGTWYSDSDYALYLIEIQAIIDKVCGDGTDILNFEKDINKRPEK